MEQLIPVKVKDGVQQLVSARNLHKALDYKSRFSRWKEQNFKMFEEGIDYMSVQRCTDMPNGGVKPIQDYDVTLDMAKELCMMSYTEIGKKIRRYFIEVEKKFIETLKNNRLPQTPEEQLKLTMRVMTRTTERVDNLEKDVTYLKSNSEIEEDKRYELELHRNRVVVKLCGGKNSNFYKEKKAPKVYRQLFRDFKRHFGVTKYATLKKRDYKEAISFTDKWSPDYELRREIEAVNSQTSLDIIDIIPNDND